MLATTYHTHHTPARMYPCPNTVRPQGLTTVSNLTKAIPALKSAVNDKTVKTIIEARGDSLHFPYLSGPVGTAMARVCGLGEKGNEATSSAICDFLLSWAVGR